MPFQWGYLPGSKKKKVYIPLNLADSIPAIIKQTYHNHLLRLLFGKYFLPIYVLLYT